MRVETKEEQVLREANEYALKVIHRIWKFSKIPSEMLHLIESEIVNAYLEGNKKRK